MKKTLGEKLIRVRNNKQLTLKKASELIGVDKTALWRVESEKDIKYSTGKKIEKWLEKNSRI